MTTLARLSRLSPFALHCRWDRFKYRARERFTFWLVWKMPNHFIEIATVRVWANATTGAYEKDQACAVTVDEALKAWRQGDGGDRDNGAHNVSY